MFAFGLAADGGGRPLRRIPARAPRRADRSARRSAQRLNGRRPACRPSARTCVRAAHASQEPGLRRRRDRDARARHRRQRGHLLGRQRRAPEAAALRPAGELVRVTSDSQARRHVDVGLSAPELFDYRDRTGVFAAISGLYPHQRQRHRRRPPRAGRGRCSWTSTTSTSSARQGPGRPPLREEGLRPGHRRLRRPLGRLLAPALRRRPERHRQTSAHRRRPVHDHRRRSAGLPPSRARHRNRRRGLGAVGLARRALPGPEPRAPTSSRARSRA